MENWTFETFFHLLCQRGAQYILARKGRMEGGVTQEGRRQFIRQWRQEKKEEGKFPWEEKKVSFSYNRHRTAVENPTAAIDLPSGALLSKVLSGHFWGPQTYFSLSSVSPSSDHKFHNGAHIQLTFKQIGLYVSLMANAGDLSAFPPSFFFLHTGLQYKEQLRAAWGLGGK